MEAVEAVEGAEKEPDAFEEAIKSIENGLEARFTPRFGSNLTEARQALLHLKSLSKIQLEGLYSSIMIISVNDAAYTRLQAKMNNLLARITEEDLGLMYTPRRGTNIAQNIANLSHLKSLEKLALEAYFSPALPLSLSDEDYNRLKQKIKDLIYENEHARRENGLE